MVILGVLLILAAVAAMAGVWMDGTGGTTPITVLDRTFNLTPFELFAAGAAAGIVFMIGLGLVGAGLRRTTARHRRRREERRSERERLNRLESEKRDLERRLRNIRTAPEDAPRPASESPATADRLVADGSRAADDRAGARR